MNDQKAMREAMKLAKTKGLFVVMLLLLFPPFSDMHQIDPAVLDYAATKLQAGFRGYMTRKNVQ